MLKNRPFLKTICVLALGALLSACDTGSVGTTSNPDTSIAASGFVYTGPAARNINVSNFQYYLWKNVVSNDRCGGCHNREASSPVSPYFFDTLDVNVAYDAAVAKDPALADISTINPFAAEFVTKLDSHFCWESQAPSTFCGSLIAGWIDDWKNAATGGLAARQINLTAPAIRDPGASRSFPASATDGGANSFANTVYPLLVGNETFISGNNCQGCHDENSPGLKQAPFFASGDVEAAYEAAKAKMDIDTPSNSRFVQRLVEQHNCWNNCGTGNLENGSDANIMAARIALFAGGIPITSIDTDLVTSMALTLGDGIIASGGNRHETDQFALWEFKNGTGRIAYDTSGVGESINLALVGSVNWVGGYGLEFSGSGGRAQADTFSSDKLYSYIQDTREYALEAWVIPANVTQEDANIVSYSGGDLERNFTLGQDMYNYESFNRVDASPAPSSPNGTPIMSTGEDNEELAQASLQHVVVNYDPFAGRSIYVNGEQVLNLTDQAAGLPVDGVWDDDFAFIIGNEISGNRPWMGQIKLVAMHSRALTEPQIQQNFGVGVGQKFYLLFYVGHHLNETGNPNSFILFEVAQFDSYSYLFNKPTFITLDGSPPSNNINISGLRIGINGKEALAGQAYANMNETVDSGSYNPATGRELSSRGTIIALEKGPESDEFFLTFEDFNGVQNAFTDITPTVPNDPTAPVNPVESDIGVRTFEEINSSISEITGVPVTNGTVLSVYKDYIQQLPSVETIDAFLPSHQMAISQLAMTSCSELVDNNPGFFAGFDFNQNAFTAFGPLSPGLPNATQLANRSLIINPLLTAAMNVDQVTPANNLITQPDAAEVSDLLGAGAAQTLDTGASVVAYDSLFTTLINTCTPAVPGDPCTPENTIPRTAQIVKGVCAAATGAAVMLVQ
jgi:hypothetical protein